MTVPEYWLKVLSLKIKTGLSPRYSRLTVGFSSAYLIISPIL